MLTTTLTWAYSALYSKFFPSLTYSGVEGGAEEGGHRGEIGHREVGHRGDLKVDVGHREDREVHEDREARSLNRQTACKERSSHN